MKTKVMFIGVLLTTASAFSRAAAQGVDGKTAFDENCKKCHGVRGVPPKLMKAKYPKLVPFDAAFAKSHPQDSIVTILNKGKNEDMKAFKGTLSPDQIKAVAKYVHDLAVPKTTP